MEFLKSLFESGALTWEQFSEAVNQKEFKICDLSKGNYVAKKKYEDDLATRDTTITELNGQISTRDTDLANLKKQLEDDNTDNSQKITNLQNELTKLQGTYDTTKTEYENKLKAQKYEFAVKEFANGKKFSSNAAKRDFIKEMLGANLVLDKDTIMGADDFTSKYKEANSDAFVVEEPKPPTPSDPKPNFITPPTPPTPSNDNPFSDMFNFVGVRPHDNK